MLGGLRRPSVPVRGRDFAGLVEAVGPGVTMLEPGDEVYGEAKGSFAEYAIATLDAIDRKPANLSFEQAAAIPLAGVAALHGRTGRGGPPQGTDDAHQRRVRRRRPYAIQIAKAYGAEVTAVCRTRNVSIWSGRSGPTTSWTTPVRTSLAAACAAYDAVFDLVGNRSMGEFRRVLRRGGVLVLSGGGLYRGGSLFGPLGLIIGATVKRRFVRDRVVVLTAHPSSAHLATLRELAEAGRPHPGHRPDLSARRGADGDLSYLEGEHARAKVVITVH